MLITVNVSKEVGIGEGLTRHLTLSNKSSVIKLEKPKKPLREERIPYWQLHVEDVT